MANLYDLKKFDLNLLVIFECIYQHLSISKAAAMLFITPSAVSQGRCEQVPDMRSSYSSGAHPRGTS